MARYSVTHKVVDEGRDKGKVFILTEMAASKAESWAMRVLMALAAGNVELPPGFERSGMSGLAQLGIKAMAGLKWEVAEPLLAEMWECVQMMPDPSKPHIIRALIEEDVEEIMTRVKLRAAIWSLHTGFLKAVAPSISGTSAAADKKSTRITKTSRQ